MKMPYGGDVDLMGTPFTMAIDGRSSVTVGRRAVAFRAEVDVDGEDSVARAVHLLPDGRQRLP